MDDHTYMQYHADESKKHSLVCIQFQREVSRCMSCVVVSKAFHYKAVDSNSKPPEGNETCVHRICAGTCQKCDAFENSAIIPEKQLINITGLCHS